MGITSADAGNETTAASHYINDPIAYTALEAPTEQDEFGPFGPTNEPIDTSGLF